MQVNKRELTTKKMVEVEVKENVYTVTFTEDELATIMMVLGQVGGDPKGSRRKHIDMLFSQLNAYSFTYADMLDKYPDFKFHVGDREIWFESENLKD